MSDRAALSAELLKQVAAIVDPILIDGRLRDRERVRRPLQNLVTQNPTTPLLAMSRFQVTAIDLLLATARVRPDEGQPHAAFWTEWLGDQSGSLA